MIRRLSRDLQIDLSPEAIVVYTFFGLVLCVVGWLFVVLFVGIFG